MSTPETVAGKALAGRLHVLSTMGLWNDVAQVEAEAVSLALTRLAEEVKGLMSQFYLEPILLDDVSGEADRARAKFGDQFDFTDGDWLAVIVEEVGEAATEVLIHLCEVHLEATDFPLARLRAEVVQIGAVAARWVAAIDARPTKEKPDAR